MYSLVHPENCKTCMFRTLVSRTHLVKHIHSDHACDFVETVHNSQSIGQCMFVYLHLKKYSLKTNTVMPLTKHYRTLKVIVIPI